MHDDKAGVGRAPQEPVELGELAALPLPAHPPPLARVPAALPVKEEKPVGAMSKVQGVDGRQGPLEQPFIACDRLRIRIGKVAEQREMQIGIAVGQEPHLEVV